jgi:DNA polymerase-3 subunit epsilon
MHTINDVSKLFIDLETTGLDPRKDRICQIAMILPDGTEFESLVNPLLPIPSSATALHGVTDEMVAEAPSFKDLAPALIHALEAADCFVAYNFSFDFQFLQYELKRSVEYELDESTFSFIDPYRIFKKMFPHKLSNAYLFYTGKEMEVVHSAIIDIRCTKEVLEQQEQRYQDLFAKDVKVIESETIGDITILGKWFISSNNKICFRQGKYKDQIVDSRLHSDYLQWIASLDDTTLSERRYIKNRLNK